MTTPVDRKCPDCQGEMATIILIDSTFKGGAHQPLQYAAGGAQRSGFWEGTRFPVAGVVEARMCGGCGRILLYGAPREQGEL